MGLILACGLLCAGSVQRTVYFQVTGEASAEPDMATVFFSISSTASVSLQTSFQIKR